MGGFYVAEKIRVVVTMNDENLIPITKRTKNEQREITSKGGKKSGEVRRKKRDMKACMEMLLQMSPGTQEDYSILAAVGVNINTITNDELNNLLVVNAALLNKAKNGDVTAFREIRNILGEDNSSAELELKKKELKLKEYSIQKTESDIADDGLVEVLITKSKDVFTDEN